MSLQLIEQQFAAASEFLVLSFKGNLEEWSDGMPTPQNLAAVQFYIRDAVGRIQASTIGVHVNGRSQVPHWHYHVIVRADGVPKTLLSNASAHRRNWLKKQTFGDFGDVTVRVTHMKSDEPRYQILSYPLKEGLTFSNAHEEMFNVFDTISMTDEMYNMLVGVGRKIYEESLAMQARRDRSEAKVLSVREAVDACIGNKVFHSFDDVLDHIVDNYYGNFTVADAPDWGHVIKAAAVVCVLRRMPIPYSKLK